MPEFFNVLPPAEALEVLKQHLWVAVEGETVDTAQSLGRILAESVRSPEELPAFPRSAMDGFAVRARDTFGATEGLPAYLKVVGEAPMGEAPRVATFTGEAATVHTGSMLPNGADSVVMVENTQQVDGTTIEVVRPVAPGENVIQPGEDVRAGDPVLEAGHRLRPQDLGGLLALGITTVRVARRPRVAIVSTGDELVTPNETPTPGQVRDVNTYTIAALTAEAGGEPVPVGIVPDDYEAQQEAARTGLERGDILIFSAGSSVSVRDITADVFNSVGQPGVLVHGISLRPGKPSIVALLDGVPAFGLPGNPVSAMTVFDLLVRPTIHLLSGRKEPSAPRSVRARLTRDVASAPGREDYFQVRLTPDGDGLSADPVFGKSNLIYTLVRSHGTVKIPMESAGLYAGQEVSVVVY